MNPNPFGSRRDLAVRVVATLSSVVLIVLAFPPPQLRLLAWGALVPLLVSIRRASLAEAVALAGAWGMLGAWGVTDWLPPAIARYYQQPLWLGTTLFLTASFVMGAVEYMAFGAFYWWAGRRRLQFLPLLAAAAWTAAELGRTRLLTGNPWGLLGYTQTAIAPDAAPLGLHAGIAPLQLIQIADLAGVYGISFVLAAFNAAVAELWVAARKGTVASTLVREAAPVLALVAAAFVYGAVRVDAGPADADRVRIAVVQGNLDLGSQWREDLYGANLDVYLEMTADVAKRSSPTIVFWPENAMTFFVDDEPAYRSAVAHVTRTADTELVAGAPRYQNPDDPVYFNSAFVLAPDGEITAHYDKERLLPFAEYFPFASDLLRRSFARVREFTPGRDTAPMPTRAGLAAITICNEAMFPHVVRERVRTGGAYLVNLSNDTWISSTEFAEQQLEIVSLRAVEQRRYLVRASTSGPSAIVDPAGRIEARTAPLERAVLVGEIRPASDLTVYARFGDWLAFGCLAIVAVVAASALFKRG